MVDRLDFFFRVTKEGYAGIETTIYNLNEAETAIQIIEKIAEIQGIMNRHAKGEISAVTDQGEAIIVERKENG